MRFSKMSRGEDQRGDRDAQSRRACSMERWLRCARRSARRRSKRSSSTTARPTRRRAVAERHAATYVFEPRTESGAGAQRRDRGRDRRDRALRRRRRRAAAVLHRGPRARARRASSPRVVTGPIINVPSPAGVRCRPSSTARTPSSAPATSRCRALRSKPSAVSIRRSTSTAGKIRARRALARDRRAPALRVGRLPWHIKPPATETLEAALEKTIEKARMAAKFVRKDPSPRAKLGDRCLSRSTAWRARVLAPRAAQPLAGGHRDERARSGAAGARRARARSRQRVRRRARTRAAGEPRAPRPSRRHRRCARLHAADRRVARRRARARSCA